MATKSESDRLYYKRHRTQILARVKARAATRREELLAYFRAYYKDHREERRASDALYGRTHREIRRAANRRWGKRHPERGAAKQARRRAWKLGAPGSHTLQEWLDKIELFGGRCAYCGKEEPLTRDHVEPLSRGGSDSIDNIVPACRQCNSRKGARAEVFSCPT